MGARKRLRYPSSKTYKHKGNRERARAQRVGSPAWHAHQNERWMIRTRHHSHPHLWRGSD